MKPAKRKDGKRTPPRRRAGTRGGPDSASSIGGWLTSEQAALYLHVTPGTLSNWRVAGRGPRFTGKTGRPLYPLSELELWLRDGLRSSTTNPPGDEARAWTARS